MTVLFKLNRKVLPNVLSFFLDVNKLCRTQKDFEFPITTYF